MDIKKRDILKYVECYLNRIFEQNVRIYEQDNYYIVNNAKKYYVYDFWEKDDKELFNDFDDFLFNEDYIGTIFFFLSGYWEYIHNNIRDEFDRFPAEGSFCFKKQILQEPVVDILVKRLAQELNLNYRNTFAKPRVFLTHDIDYLRSLEGFKFIKSLCGDLLKRKDSKLFLDKVIKKMTGQNPHSVRCLLESHKKYDIKGNFFFMPDIQLKETVGGYKPLQEKAYLQKINEEIISLGSNIGIHYDSRYLKEDRMGNDIKLLEEIFGGNIKSGRAHFLMFDIKKSFDIFEKAKIKIDTTCSFAESIGFRFGTSCPFKPYNFNERKEYDLIEIPLVVMDGSLQNKKYMNLTPEEGFFKTKEIIDKLKRYNGIFTFLWHNTSFYIHPWKEWEWVYEQIIQYAQEQGFEFINQDTIINDYMKCKRI